MRHGCRRVALNEVHRLREESQGDSHGRLARLTHIYIFLTGIRMNSWLKKESIISVCNVVQLRCLAQERRWVVRPFLDIFCYLRSMRGGAPPPWRTPKPLCIAIIYQKLGLCLQSKLTFKGQLSIEKISAEQNVISAHHGFVMVHELPFRASCRRLCLLSSVPHSSPSLR